MTDQAPPRTYGIDRVFHVDVGGGAAMTVPLGSWMWKLRYGKDTTPPTICDDRMLAAGICESYRYLIEECTKEEAWRRIKIMRAAIKNTPDPNR